MILRTNPFEDWLFEDKVVSDTLLTKSESVREIGFALKGNIDNVIEKIENICTDVWKNADSSVNQIIIACMHKRKKQIY